jgi:hypothetical protein
MQVNGNLQHSPHWLQLPVRVFSTGRREVRVRVSFGNISSYSNAMWRQVYNPGRWLEVRRSLHIRGTAGGRVRGQASVMLLVVRRAEFRKSADCAALYAEFPLS